MKGADLHTQPDKSKSVKKTVVLGQEISEDLLKKMNFIEARNFCLSIENELRKFLVTPSMCINS
jgi:hypothetical protein